MKTASALLLVSVQFFLLHTSLAAVTANEGPSPDQGTPAPARQERVAKGAEKKIIMGMSGEDLRKTIGNPASIAPLVVKGRHAEVWTYRRPLGTRVRQISTSVQRQPSLYAPGSCKHETLLNEPVIQLETLQVTEVTELLLFNNELIVAKRHEETRPASVD